MSDVIPDLCSISLEEFVIEQRAEIASLKKRITELDSELGISHGQAGFLQRRSDFYLASLQIARLECETALVALGEAGSATVYDPSWIRSKPIGVKAIMESDMRAYHHMHKVLTEINKAIYIS